MIRLSREIRFAMVAECLDSKEKPGNSWAGWPSTNRVVPHLTLTCLTEGTPDPTTGFLCNIKCIDDVLRSIVTDRLIPEFDSQQTAEEILKIVADEVASRWELPAQVISIRLALSPFLSYSIFLDNKVNSTPPTIYLTQQFEFSAAHRLHCDELTDEENRELFGKCNNPEGHGHNYVVEVTVSAQIDSEHPHVIEMRRFEATVRRFVIDRLDHRHLNRDLDYFSTINPTVENLAIAIYQWLEWEFDDADLETVKVFETPKTWAEYSGIRSGF